MTASITAVAEALATHMPEVLRWAGAIARQLRKFNVALGGKSSGSAETDALTLADLTVQELVVSALRDRSPLFRQCRIEAEEANGDIGIFATDAELTIALDRSLRPAASSPSLRSPWPRAKTTQRNCCFLRIRALSVPMLRVHRPPLRRFAWAPLAV